ncbi:multiple sugar transport system permease protein [Skermanella aerolata]|jgi:multiple sugar transport system permease protein|uniref:Binding-protein-dependent transport systems inner membrane component n=1 Tax=Skermanella aerolata TaxID=393310 RepID=A0A512DVM1_9PROT|nr:carbohydrate ABC transporter permease [Skermanella aerolata]KJB94465.1 ABC transporter permease [Skermanella aerolata KACC 11604]GEO40514.1 binding-protein-dependent transport systems inner membrane component [Skermanella aerolata]
MAVASAENTAVRQASAPAKPKRLVNAWHLVGLLAIFLFAVFPFYWMVATSLKTQAEALASPPIWVFTPNLDNYYSVLFNRDVLSSLINSVIIAVSTTVLAVGLGTPAAYALARFEFKSKEELWFWFITNRMLSPIVVALPIFIMARTLNLIDTHLVLVLVYLTFNLPIVVWICTDQFRGVPRDLDEAARLAGASRFTIFWRIALPLAMPGVAVSAIFSFIFSWNELLYALVLTRNTARTAPVAATSFMSGYDLPWGEIMATGTLIVLPVIVFALIVSKHLVQGLTMGAVK